MTEVKQLLSFLANSEKRIAAMLHRAEVSKNVEEYRSVINELESLVVDSRVHCYGTRFMQLGHEHSHLNLFIETGESAIVLLSLECNLIFTILISDNSYWLTQDHDKVAEMVKMFKQHFDDEVKLNLKISEDIEWVWKGRVQVLKIPIPTVRAIIEPRRLTM